eukprot:7386362-Prymnesium_polylepis.2
MAPPAFEPMTDVTFARQPSPNFSWYFPPGSPSQPRRCAAHTPRSPSRALTRCTSALISFSNALQPTTSFWL